MIRLYLKTIILVIALSVTFLSVNHAVYSYYTTQGFNRVNKVLSQGTFSYLQDKLSQAPRSQWQLILNSVQPKDAPTAKILPMDSLNTSKKDKKQLLEGKIITTTGSRVKYHYYLYYGLFETYAMQRIGNTKYVLEIALTEPVNYVIKGTMRWMSHIILREISNSPKAQWPDSIKQLQSKFGVPLNIVSTDNSQIGKKIKYDLIHYGAAFSVSSDNKSITTVYFPTKESDLLLQIGPINYTHLSNLFSVEQYCYFIIISIVALLIVIFLTWLFSRNVRNIYSLTKGYSDADFSQHGKVSRYSILHSTYQNVISMGNKLKYLIESRENMTRFVAHEIRTPLSTMQLAVDALNKEQSLSKDAKEKIASIQDDIDEINKLVVDFLLYHKATSCEIKPKCESLNVVQWLSDYIQKYQLTNNNIQLNISCESDTLIYVDPVLLKHVIDNLMTNALKFANHRILVSVLNRNNCLVINVEDDGIGIPAQTIQHLFEPFVAMGDRYDTHKHIGLGLTIAKSIIELHNGSIIASESKQLGGAKFIITLPIAKN